MLSSLAQELSDLLIQKSQTFILTSLWLMLRGSRLSTEWAKFYKIDCARCI